MALSSRHTTYILTLFISFFAFADQPQSVGEIGAVKGRIIIARSIGSSVEQISAKKGEALYNGDEITTGKASKVILKLHGGHSIVVTPESFYRISYHEAKNTTQSLTKILYGTIKATVNKINKKTDNFEIHTPNSILGVRGTEFIVNYIKNSETTRIYATEGEVQVQSARFSSDNKIIETSKPKAIKNGEWTQIKGNAAATNLPQVATVTNYSDQEFESANEAFKEEEEGEGKLTALNCEEGIDDSRIFELGAKINYFESRNIFASPTLNWTGRSPCQSYNLGVHGSVFYHHAPFFGEPPATAPGLARDGFGFEAGGNIMYSFNENAHLFLSQSLGWGYFFDPDHNNIQFNTGLYVGYEDFVSKTSRLGFRIGYNFSAYHFYKKPSGLTQKAGDYQHAVASYIYFTM